MIFGVFIFHHLDTFFNTLILYFLSHFQPHVTLKSLQAHSKVNTMELFIIITCTLVTYGMTKVGTPESPVT